MTELALESLKPVTLILHHCTVFTEAFSSVVLADRCGQSQITLLQCGSY